MTQSPGNMILRGGLMDVFDEKDCELLAKALERAYHSFVSAGCLNEKTIDIAKPTLSRAIIHNFSVGERDEKRLAKYAQIFFHDFIDGISDRDLSYFKGDSAALAVLPHGK